MTESRPASVASDLTARCSTAETDKAWIARVLDEAVRRVDTIEGGTIRVDGRGEVWLHTQDQVKTWLVGLIADALCNRWEWTDGT